MRCMILALLPVVLAPGCKSAPVAPWHCLERSLVFRPHPYPQGDWEGRPAHVEDAHFTAADGTRLHGWYFRHPRPRAVVLHCHGNGGNVTGWAVEADELRRRVGVSVLAFDYRGYGRSEGIPTEEGLLADARAARAWLARREGIAEREIVLLGRSLGGAVAVDLARDGARALVLERTFNTLPDTAAAHAPLLPVRSMMRMRFDSESKIAAYHGPLLQSHGDRDRVVPIALGRKLHEAANPPKRFVTLRGIGHNDPPPESYYEELSRLLDEAGCGVPRAVAGRTTRSVPARPVP